VTADPNILRKLEAFKQRMGWLEPDEEKAESEEQSRLDTSEKAFEEDSA
jgi:hypothetical protein